MTTNEQFLEITSVYDLNALRQIMEGMEMHAKFFPTSSNEAIVMSAVAHSLRDFLNARQAAQ